MKCPNCDHRPMEHDRECDDYACPQCGLCGPMETLITLGAAALELEKFRAGQMQPVEAFPIIRSALRTLAGELSKESLAEGNAAVARTLRNVADRISRIVPDDSGADARAILGAAERLLRTPYERRVVWMQWHTKGIHVETTGDCAVYADSLAEAHAKLTGGAHG